MGAINSTLIEISSPQPCCYCGEKSNTVSLVFEAVMCSLRCEDAYIDEMSDYTIVGVDLEYNPMALELFKRAAKLRKDYVRLQNKLEGLN